MATIAITTLPEEGHLIPSFKLARTLQAQGHRVYYIGLIDFERHVTEQGLEFVPFLTEPFPAGTRQQQNVTLATKKGLAYIKEASQTRFYQEMCRLAQPDNDELARLFAGRWPQLWIVDTFLAPLALAAYRLQIPTMQLGVNFNLPQGANYPPVVTDIIPDSTPASRSKVKTAWGISRLTRKITGALIGFNFDKALKQVAAACGYPTEDVQAAAMYPRLRPSAALPELVLCPQIFDFPRTGADLEGLHYIEASVDLQRKANDFPWERIDAAKTLVFCTLGSQSHIYAHSRRLFQAAIDAVAQRPDWQLVMAVGRQIDPASFERVPANAVIVPWAPHAEMLQRAAVMINQGGLGTIKECIFFGVPMLVFPITRDQPGLAARVVYHEIGLRGSMRKATSDDLLEMLTLVLADTSFSERVAAMSDVFHSAEEAGAGLALIQAYLQRAPAARATKASVPALATASNEAAL